MPRSEKRKDVRVEIWLPKGIVKLLDTKAKHSQVSRKSIIEHYISKQMHSLFPDNDKPAKKTA